MRMLVLGLAARRYDKQWKISAGPNNLTLDDRWILFCPIMGCMVLYFNSKKSENDCDNNSNHQLLKLHKPFQVNRIIGFALAVKH